MALTNELWSLCVRRILFDDALEGRGYETLLTNIPSLNIGDIPTGSRVLIRGDIDVPLNSDRTRVEDPERLLSLTPVIDLCKQRQLIPVVFGHIGRDKANTAKPLVSEVERLFDLKCSFVADWMDDSSGEVPLLAAQQISQAAPGTFVLLEQTRKYDLERLLWDKTTATAADLTPDVIFAAARSMSVHVSPYYVFDALASHNPDWSSVVVPGAMTRAYLGPYGYAELVGPLRRVRNARIVILSGLKIDKLDALEAVVQRGTARLILCGGSIAMALVKANGGSIGLAEDPSSKDKKWYIPEPRVEQARRISAIALENGVELLTPIDYVLDDGTVATSIPKDRAQRDIGPGSIALFTRKIEMYVRGSSTPSVIFYNGALGQFELAEFARGTQSFVEFLCELAKSDERAQIYVGGGDGRLTLARFGDPAAAAHIFTSGGTVLKVIGDRNLNYLKSLYVYNKLHEEISTVQQIASAR
ncbi:MAG TPA: phosphoglycerate kinase [Thermoanaerobaculia bacterium]|jgi:phosphoglycerate kinase|nr:phosphoglycerate kinase [Thermoanaerobaculia bacterium]